MLAAKAVTQSDQLAGGQAASWRQVTQDGSACGCYPFTRNTIVKHWQAKQQAAGGGCRHRQHAMGSGHLPTAKRQRRQAPAGSIDAGDQVRRQHYVGYGIPGTHFMEGHLCNLLAVDVSLHHSYAVEDVKGYGLDFICQIGLGDYFPDFPVVAVVVVCLGLQG